MEKRWKFTITGSQSQGRRASCCCQGAAEARGQGKTKAQQCTLPEIRQRQNKGIAQSCPTLWEPMDYSLPGSSAPGILQARILEWVAISFSSVWKWKEKVKLLSHVRPSATSWTTAYQAPLPMGFSRQEYWSVLPLPSPYMEFRKMVIMTLYAK